MLRATVRRDVPRSWLLLASLAEPGGCSTGGCGEGGLFLSGWWVPSGSSRVQLPQAEGGTGKPILGRAAGAGLVLLGCIPGCQGSGAGASRGFYSGTRSSGAALARPRIPEASIVLRRSLPAPRKRVSRASTLASGRRRMDLSAQPPPSSSSQKGNGLKMWQVLIITNANPLPPPSPASRPLRAPSLPLGLYV